jgi:hypothetical protein
LEFFLFVDSLLSLVNLFRLIPANNETCCLPGFVEFSEDFTPLTEFLAFLSPESTPLFTFSPEQLMVAGEGEEGGVPQLSSSCRVLRFGFLPLSGGTLMFLITSIVGVVLTILRFLKPLGSNKRKHLSVSEMYVVPRRDRHTLGGTDTH